MYIFIAWVNTSSLRIVTCSRKDSEETEEVAMQIVQVSPETVQLPLCFTEATGEHIITHSLIHSLRKCICCLGTVLMVKFFFFFFCHATQHTG